jgi:hypothetical protein
MRNIAKKTKGKDSRLESELFESVKRRKFNATYNFRNAKDTVKLAYRVPQDYYPDLIITQKDTGHTIYVEIKGWFKPSDRVKMLAVKKCNPDADIRLVFQADNFLTKAKKKRYSEWADKNGFEWAVGSIPDDWK